MIAICKFVYLKIELVINRVFSFKSVLSSYFCPRAQIKINNILQSLNWFSFHLSWYMYL